MERISLFLMERILGLGNLKLVIKWLILLDPRKDQCFLVERKIIGTNIRAQYSWTTL